MSTETEKLQNLIKRDVFRSGKEIKGVNSNGSPLTWAFDFRNILLQPNELELMADIFIDTFKDSYPYQVGGLETSAIPLIAAIVMRNKQNGLPVNGFYIRKSRKKVGFQKSIEGNLNDHKIILVDDLISSGESFEKQVKILEETQKSVFSIFVFVNFKRLNKYQFANKRNIEIRSVFQLPEFGINFLEDKKVNKQKADIFHTKWKVKAKNPNLFFIHPKSSLILDENSLYYYCDSGHLISLKQEDGSKIWDFKVGLQYGLLSVFPSPKLFGGKIFIGSCDGNFYSINSQTGKREWVFSEADWIGSSPEIGNNIDTIFIGIKAGLIRRKGGLIALDAYSGKKKWEHEISTYSDCSPSYNEERKVVAIGSNKGKIYLFNAVTGNLLWKRQMDGSIQSSSTFDTKRNTILVPTSDGTVNIYDIDTGKLVHTFEANDAILSTPLVLDNKLFYTSLDKKLYCVDLDTFKEDWTFQASDKILASPVVINGLLYIGSNDGILYGIKPETGERVDMFQTTERITNSIIHNPKTGMFFLSTFANEIYCLEKREN